MVSVSISYYRKPVDFSILNLSGKPILDGKIESKQHDIDISTLRKGMYFVSINKINYPILHLQSIVIK